MDHIVSLDSGAQEIENLINGAKTMIIRGADIKCVPYGMVAEGDILYFVTVDNCSEIRARAVVLSVYNSYQLSSEESFEMIIRNQDRLILPDDQFYKWAGKKYLVLIGIRDAEEVQSFQIDRSITSNAEGWYTARNLHEIIFRNCKIA